MSITFSAASSQEIDAGTEYAVMRTTFSISFWVRTTQVGSDVPWQAPGVTGSEETGGNDDVMIGILDASGHIGICVGTGTPTDVFNKTTTVVNTGAWFHVALTRDASTGQVNVYCNGSLEDTSTRGTGTIGTTWVSIGKNDTTAGTDVFLNGTVDDVRVYDRVLSQNEVNALCSCRGGDDIAYGLVHRYRMDESYPSSTVSTTYDQAGTNDSTGVNSPVYAEHLAGIRRPA